MEDEVTWGWTGVDADGRCSVGDAEEKLNDEMNDEGSCDDDDCAADADDCAAG